MDHLVARAESRERASAPRGDARQPERALGPDARPPTEIAFLTRYGAPAGALLLATIEAAKCNSSCDQALLGEGLMRDEVFYRFLAAHLNAPFYTGEIAVDQSVDAARAVWSGVAPLAPNDRGLRHLLAPRGAAITLLLRAAQRGGVPDDIAIASPQRFGAATRAAAARSIAHAGAFDLKTYDAELTAHSRLTLAQTAAAIVSALASLVLWALNPDWLGSVFSVALFIIFASSIGLRLAAVAARSPFFSAEPIADADLPIYSIVAPLYREANMVDQLVAAFDAIDYPRAKLDVKIVVEEDDIETLRAIARRRLPARYDIVVAPAGAPRTKPRALNIALPFVRGSYVVVFDAEDMPAPDQLRCAAAYFAAAPDVGCLQARLVVHNAATSWLATMYAIEYAALFGVINPGLAALGAPIALGGTSNHFRTAALRRVGGWDAWNLTEDADLGIRLARFGVRVATFDSDTYEEAPARLSHWLGQRRRWQKGWLQTALVHSRNPARLVRELGAARAFSALGLIGGTILGCLFGPLFTVLALWRAAFGDLLAPATPFQAFVSIMAISMLLSGLTAILVPTILGLRRRGLGRFSWALALLPIYYCLISLATWLAVYDFVFWPFYWCKTQHGVGFARPPSPVQPE